MKRQRLLQLMGLISSIPVVCRGHTMTMERECTRLLGSNGILKTDKLSFDLRKRIQEHLSSRMKDEEIPGVFKDIADTGASHICLNDKSRIMNNSYQKLTTTKTIDGIAGRLTIAGKGKTSVEFITR